MKEKFYGDWEKTPAKIIPIVKVDPFYNEAREGLCVDKRHRFAFVDQYPSIPHPLPRVNLHAWRYLDILTDGGINPDNNHNLYFEGNSLCQIRFDDGYVHNINGEVHNFPLVNKKFMDFYNTVGQSQIDSLPNETVETGYGNIWFILKKYPFVREIIKHNPHFCNTGTIIYEDSFDYWVGINRPTGWNLAIPFLPVRYGCMMVCFYATHPDITLTIDQHCCLYGSNYICRQDLVASNTTPFRYCASLPVCSQRHHFNVTSASQEENQAYCLDVKYLEGCYNACQVPV